MGMLFELTHRWAGGGSRPSQSPALFSIYFHDQIPIYHGDRNASRSRAADPPGANAAASRDDRQLTP
eukprot:6205823-Pleurochrysis_carterae.AAC.1